METVGPSRALEGRTALVTGSSRGIGQLVAEALAREGARVFVHGRTEAASAVPLARVVAASAGRADHVVLPANLAVGAEVEALADRVTALGGADILYNNAAIMHPWRSQIEDHTLGDWSSSFQVNVFAVMRLCARLIPAMRRRNWGRVINVTSGIRQTPQLAGYGASKAAIDKFTADLAFELEGTGVIVSRLDPGWLRTDMGGHRAPNDPATVLPGALVPVLLSDDAPGGQLFQAQDYAREF